MDVDSIVDGWRAKGMTVHKVRELMVPAHGLTLSAVQCIARSCLLCKSSPFGQACNSLPTDAPPHA